MPTVQRACSDHSASVWCISTFQSLLLTSISSTISYRYQFAYVDYLINYIRHLYKTYLYMFVHIEYIDSILQCLNNIIQTFFRIDVILSQVEIDDIVSILIRLCSQLRRSILIVDFGNIILISIRMCVQRNQVLSKFVPDLSILFSISCWFCNLTFMDIVVGLAFCKCRYRCRTKFILDMYQNDRTYIPRTCHTQSI